LAGVIALIFTVFLAFAMESFSKDDLAQIRGTLKQN